MSETIITTTCGISVGLQVQAPDQWGLTHDGLIWHLDGATIVQAGHDGTPALDPTGAARRQDGTRIGQGFDTTSDTYDPREATRLPIRLRPGQRLLLCHLGTMQQQGGVLAQSRDYWPEFPVQSAVKRLGGVICVDRPPASSLDLRPPMFGGPGQAILRQWIPDEQLRAGVARMPRRSEIQVPARNWFREFTGDVLSGWNAHMVAPAEQHPGYGREFAAASSMTAMRLCGPEDDETKLALARGLVQHGLDQMAALLAGRELYAKGGHCAGRKIPIVLGGFLLGIREMQDATTTGRTNGIAFPLQEDDACRMGQVWWTDQATPTWRMASDSGPTLDGSEWARPPASWQAGTQHQDFPWAVHGYYGHFHAAQVGSAGAARLLGLAREMGPAVESVRLFMDPPAVMRDALARFEIPWGTSWGDQDACANSYRRLFLS